MTTIFVLYNIYTVISNKTAAGDRGILNMFTLCKEAGNDGSSNRKEIRERWINNRKTYENIEGKEHH